MVWDQLAQVIKRLIATSGFMGIVWVFLVAVFSHVDLMADLMLGSLRTDAIFDWDAYMRRGSLCLFSTTLVTTIVVDHILFDVYKKCNLPTNCFAILLPFLVIISSVAAYMILRTASSDSALDMGQVAGLQVILVFVALTYALGVKALQFAIPQDA